MRLKGLLRGRAGEEALDNRIEAVACIIRDAVSKIIDKNS